MMKAKAMRCSKCHAAIAWDRTRARDSIHCAQCGEILVVPEWYWDTLWRLSFLVGLAVAWIAMAGTPSNPFPGGCLGLFVVIGVGFALSIPLMKALTMIVPYIVAVPLKIHGDGFITTLGLNSRS